MPHEVEILIPSTALMALDLDFNLSKAKVGVKLVRLRKFSGKPVALCEMPRGLEWLERKCDFVLSPKTGYGFGRFRRSVQTVKDRVQQARALAMAAGF